MAQGNKKDKACSGTAFVCARRVPASSPVNASSECRRFPGVPRLRLQGDTEPVVTLTLVTTASVMV